MSSFPISPNSRILVDHKIDLTWNLLYLDKSSNELKSVFRFNIISLFNILRNPGNFTLDKKEIIQHIHTSIGKTAPNALPSDTNKTKTLIENLQGIRSKFYKADTYWLGYRENSHGNKDATGFVPRREELAFRDFNDILDPAFIAESATFMQLGEVIQNIRLNSLEIDQQIKHEVQEIIARALGDQAPSPNSTRNGSSQKVIPEPIRTKIEGMVKKLLASITYSQDPEIGAAQEKAAFAAIRQSMIGESIVPLIKSAMLALYHEQTVNRDNKEFGEQLKAESKPDIHLTLSGNFTRSLKKASQDYMFSLTAIFKHIHRRLETPINEAGAKELARIKGERKEAQKMKEKEELREQIRISAEQRRVDSAREKIETLKETLEPTKRLLQKYLGLIKTENENADALLAAQNQLQEKMQASQERLAKIAVMKPKIEELSRKSDEIQKRKAEIILKNSKIQNSILEMKEELKDYERLLRLEKERDSQPKKSPNLESIIEELGLKVFEFHPEAYFKEELPQQIFNLVSESTAKTSEINTIELELENINSELNLAKEELETATREADSLPSAIQSAQKAIESAKSEHEKAKAQSHIYANKFLQNFQQLMKEREVALTEIQQIGNPERASSLMLEIQSIDLSLKSMGEQLKALS
ncbi:MAG: hypothetical protein JSS60_03350 [Verrucomicrobia bacterium]|nr:hypothetical protein [Verrucomicrobiota bacterium]